MMKRFDHDAAMSKIMTEHGAFFAFSNKQFDEAKKPDVKYIGLGGGLIAPEDRAASLIANFETLTAEKINWELANNTKKEIIWSELANHECQIVGSYREIVELLEPYQITEADIKAEWPAYYDNCVENNYF